MITYLKGNITDKSPTHLVVETGGIGYFVNISLITYSVFEKLDSGMVYIYHHIREDAQTLYGFGNEAERKMFCLLISVSGVGPATAQVILSTLSLEELQGAVVSEDEVTLNKVKGVGKKTSKQIILDLKGKIEKEVPDIVVTANTRIRDSAIEALVYLKVNKKQAEQVIDATLADNPGLDQVEELTRLALRML